jgi:hypothetical protein
MCVIYKAGLGSLLISMIILMTIGCRQQAAVPENNDFSYLEPEYTKKPISFKEDKSADSSVNVPNKRYACSQSNTDIVGVLNRIEYFGPPGYGKTPAKDAVLEGLVLRIGKEIEVSCGGNTNITTHEVLLEIPKDMTYEYLIGGTILARGQLELTGNTSGTLPLKMKVLRMQSVQPSLQ